MEYFVILITTLSVIILIFLICREIVCWYFKINLSIRKYDEIVILLKEIKDKMGQMQISNIVNESLNSNVLGSIQRAGEIKETKETNKIPDQWVSYGSSDEGDCYYDRQNIQVVSPNIIRVFDKISFSPIGKDKQINYLKEHNQFNEGYNKLCDRIILLELDLRKRTFTSIKLIETDIDGNVITETDIPNPKSSRIIPGSRRDKLLQIVSKEKSTLKSFVNDVFRK